MRSIALIVAVAATPLLLAPAFADGIPGYREEVNPPEAIPYRRVEPRVIVPPVVVEEPVYVVPRVIVRRPVFVEPPVIVARPRFMMEPRLYAYSPGPVVRFGPPGRHLGHFRHGY